MEALDSTARAPTRTPETQKPDRHILSQSNRFLEKNLGPGDDSNDRERNNAPKGDESGEMKTQKPRKYKNCILTGTRSDPGHKHTALASPTPFVQTPKHTGRATQTTGPRETGTLTIPKKRHTPAGKPDPGTAVQKQPQAISGWNTGSEAGWTSARHGPGRNTGLAATEASIAPLAHLGPLTPGSRGS